MLEPKVWQITAGSVVVGLLVAAGAVAAAGPWDNGQRKAERQWAVAQGRTGGAHHEVRPAPGAAREPAPAPSAGAVLAALGGSGQGSGLAAEKTPASVPRTIARKLDPLFADPALGSRHTGVVVDVATGKQLYAKGAAVPMTPASTVKLATMTAALSALGPDHRIATTVVAGSDGRKVTLVGGGDATLDTKGLAALADQTAKALRTRGVKKVHLGFDTSLYSGPRQHPIGPNDNIAPVVALMSNEGRLDRSTTGPAPRSGDPAGAAAREFAALLRDRGIGTTAPPRPERAARDAERVARIWSAPLSALVERALTQSDNDIAESLARQTAVAADEPASFAGAGRAVLARLKKLKLPLTGARLSDGSGLSRQDKVSASLLTALLVRDGDQQSPELRPVLTGLPIAGFSGTLRARFADAAPAAGLIRAKTGTLTGVNTLAGTVVDADGRLLAFAFMAGSTPGPDAAQKALDRLAATLVPTA
ncbi:D-alanyl-D-alanine carboxypeptidase [Streptomyces sp. AcH 505]|uniref:D-alanyl-D-alanine carboxypeptidase/D-alanyl-D-alanine endopeptidase n=1 Tax=Streptomyces sp. AcH 505 TaxID=352211 RepID=UPI000591A6B7|nr:D-alanyl-D-alanine carboxypeptidase [Streptomyces sp. AcH 505]